MTENITPEEQAILDEVMLRRRTNDRHLVPSQKVKQFLQVLGDELKRTGDLNKEFVDRVLAQLKSGEL